MGHDPKNMDEKEIKEVLTGLLASLGEDHEVEVCPLSGSGSNRSYFRLFADHRSYIATYVPDAKEGLCFIRLADAFRKAGRDVPQVLAHSDDGHFYIQEDLGDASLFSMLGSREATELIKESLLRLVRLQQTPESVWRKYCMAGAFGRRQAMWDLNYFKYEYLKPREIVFDEDRLEDDFERLACRLDSIKDEYMGFMMRDCQSRNVMVAERGPVFIDFQGGRPGPVLYDAVSMLWQARAGFDPEFRMKMIDFYCDAFCGGQQDKKREMLSSLGDIVLFRTLQVLGAYGFRGLVQRKAHFLLSIPGALANLSQLIDDGILDSYPELKRCAQLLTCSLSSADKKGEGGLLVEVISFSYKKGYPDDLSGNGGGFMFDCRALHNPGRYVEYRNLTGRDKQVADFLESQGEVEGFLKSAWALTDAAIERYVRRRFTRLQIGFGCTGGQHRSVYSAERTAAHIRRLFPEVKVLLRHREQNILESI